MGRAGKDRLGDKCVGFTVEGRVEDDRGGWGCGRGKAGSGIQSAG